MKLINRNKKKKSSSSWLCQQSFIYLHTLLITFWSLSKCIDYNFFMPLAFICFNLTWIKHNTFLYKPLCLHLFILFFKRINQKQYFVFFFLCRLLFVILNAIYLSVRLLYTRNNIKSVITVRNNSRKKRIYWGTENMNKYKKILYHQYIVRTEFHYSRLFDGKFAYNIFLWHTSKFHNHIRIPQSIIVLQVSS